jgi:dTDP-4-dehydrorhamnose 3,5-epimerase
MRFIGLGLEDLTLVQPSVFEDNRGTFRRNFCLQKFNEQGLDFSVKQGNVSENVSQYTLRGFHYQKSPSNESKLLTPITGSIYNVVIDLRSQSPSFLKVFSITIRSDKRESLLVPSGCANCFLTLEENTIVQYYMNDFFREDSYAGFRYDDPFFNIQWPHLPMIISKKDLMWPRFSLDIL